VLTVLAFSAAFAGEAFAAEPGESSSWNPERVYNNQQVVVRGTLSEARNNGVLLEAWRGATNNQVWMALDNGAPFTIGNTATFVSPTVVPWAQGSFAVFHTGTDGNIYWTFINTLNGSNGGWMQVPGQTTNLPVSVTQTGPGSAQLYMVYRGVGNDQRVWGTRWNGAWQAPQNIAGADSPSAPSVTYNSGFLFAVVRGEDNQVYMIPSFNNGATWQVAQPQAGATTPDAPTISASAQSEQMLVALRGMNSDLFYRTYDVTGDPTGGWSEDVTGWQTANPPGIGVSGRNFYTLVTGLDGRVWWKPTYTS
jgi:hypothetical protein